MKDNNLWHLFFWKEWYDMLYRKYITPENIIGKGQPKQYDKVFTFDEETGEPTEYFVKPIEYQKVIFVEKDRYTYMLPEQFESQLPLKPIKYFECLEKKSNKTVFRFVQKVSSVNVPSDSLGKSFREMVDKFNPIEHTNPLHNTLMKLLAISSAYKGVGICVCSQPEFGKGVNFGLLKYLGQKTLFLTDPTKAFLYQGLLTNNILVFDEMTTCKSEMLREVETTIKKLKDNTPELPKQALKWGSQKSEADLRKKSTIFTYNRPQDLKKAEKAFENIWSNPGAIFSRLPRFLFEGSVAQSMNNPNDAAIEEAIENNAQFFKDNTMMMSYWVKNLHTQLKGWGRDTLNLKGRHYTNVEGWIDAIEAYSQTNEEFQSYLTELNNMQENYKRMLQGKTVLSVNNGELKIEDINKVEEEII